MSNRLEKYKLQTALRARTIRNAVLHSLYGRPGCTQLPKNRAPPASALCAGAPLPAFARNR
jgi:hypothetical protein